MTSLASPCVRARLESSSTTPRRGEPTGLLLLLLFSFSTSFSTWDPSFSFSFKLLKKAVTPVLDWVADTPLLSDL